MNGRRFADHARQVVADVAALSDRAMDEAPPAEADGLRQLIDRQRERIAKILGTERTSLDAIWN